VEKIEFARRKELLPIRPLMESTPQLAQSSNLVQMRDNAATLRQEKQLAVDKAIAELKAAEQEEQKLNEDYTKLCSILGSQTPQQSPKGYLGAAKKQPTMSPSKPQVKSILHVNTRRCDYRIVIKDQRTRLCGAPVNPAEPEWITFCDECRNVMNKRKARR
jgi:hypothetical protein